MRGRVVLDDLADGLAGLPGYVIGVGLRRPVVAVLCRRHVSRSTLAAAGARPSAEAVLLVGGPGPALAAWCAVCRGLVPAGEPTRELVVAGEGMKT